MQTILSKTLTPLPVYHILYQTWQRFQTGSHPADGSFPTEVFSWEFSGVSSICTWLLWTEHLLPCALKAPLLPPDITHSLHACLCRCLRLFSNLLSYRPGTWHGYFLMKAGTHGGKKLRSRVNGTSSLWGNQAVGQDWKGEAAKWDGLLKYNKKHTCLFCLELNHLSELLELPPLPIFKRADPWAPNSIKKRSLTLTPLHPMPCTKMGRTGSSTGQEGIFLSQSQMQGLRDLVHGFLLCGNAFSFASSLSSGLTIYRLFMESPFLCHPHHRESLIAFDLFLIS